MCRTAPAAIGGDKESVASACACMSARPVPPCYPAAHHTAGQPGTYKRPLSLSMPTSCPPRYDPPPPSPYPMPARIDIAETPSASPPALPPVPPQALSPLLHWRWTPRRCPAPWLQQQASSFLPLFPGAETTVSFGPLSITSALLLPTCFPPASQYGCEGVQVEKRPYPPLTLRPPPPPTCCPSSS